MTIEIARGCTEGCRFCQAGMIYRPVRERDPEQIVDTVLRALDKSGHDEVSLTALSTADFSCISPLIKKLVEKTAPERVSLGVASLRAYGLGRGSARRDAQGARQRAHVRARGRHAAHARRGQQERHRRAAARDGRAHLLARLGKMKLYFMIGLPTEDDEDVRGIVDVGKRALAVGKRRGRVGRGHGQRLDARAQAAHAVPVVRDGHARTRSRASRSMLRDAARGMRGLELRTHDADDERARGRLRARRSPPRAT